jgi:hypothetical protein
MTSTVLTAKPIGVDGSERRLEPRSSFGNGLSLHVRTAAQGGVQQAQLRDMSKSGVGLETRTFIPPGTSLAFTFGLERLVTQVRWCSQTSSGFVVGAEIQEIDSAARQAPLTAKKPY